MWSFLKKIFSKKEPQHTPSYVELFYSYKDLVIAIDDFLEAFNNRKASIRDRLKYKKELAFQIRRSHEFLKLKERELPND